MKQMIIVLLPALGCAFCGFGLSLLDPSVSKWWAVPYAIFVLFPSLVGGVALGIYLNGYPK
jgi:hypothetical protein